MRILQRRSRGPVPEGAESPLAAAAKGRDDALVDTLAAAIRHGETALAFQPVFRAQPPHDALFQEGFIRIFDATGRILPLREALPLIENTELGRTLDRQALDIGLRTLARHPRLRLSINLSARSIGYRPWLDLLESTLAQAPRLGERLMLEIGEASAAALPELVIDLMDRLQIHGVAFALDHFGSGQTSFRQFREFFFDAVKIDAQFVHGVARSSGNQAVVKALVAVAREFDMMVIANAIERVEDAEFLVRAGVECLQGHLFAAPTLRPDWAVAEDARRPA